MANPGGLSLLASFLGALLPFVGAVYLFWQRVKIEDDRAQEALDRERDSLLFLVNVDVYQNSFKLGVVKDRPDESAKSKAYSDLYKSNWEASRVRLTQMLTNEELNILARYYGSIYEIEVNSHDERNAPEEETSRKREARRRVISNAAEVALGWGEEITDRSAERMGVSREFFDFRSTEEMPYYRGKQ